MKVAKNWQCQIEWSNFLNKSGAFSNNFSEFLQVGLSSFWSTERVVKW